MSTTYNQKMLFAFLLGTGFFGMSLPSLAEENASMAVLQQAGTVTGVVKDATGEPIIGASVMIKGAGRQGTITDLDGKFSLKAAQGSVLSVSYVGFTPQQVTVTGTEPLNIVLKENTANLDELVVIGYGAVKKSDLTSSIAAVKGEDLKLETGNAMNALQGKVNGVQIASAGSPGATPRVVIRGVSSINGSDPLYVVDGMPVGNNINFLNDDDIESMQVLKDASAAAIYGTRGSNGVILITTKHGKKGKTKFTFSANAGFQTLSNPGMAGATEYEKVQKMRYTNDGNEPVWNENNASNTDWWKESFRKAALIHNYNLGFTGGNDHLLYAVSVGYYGQDSQYKGAGNWQKLTARMNMEYTFNKVVKAGIDFSPKYERWQDTPALMTNIMHMDPTTPVMKPQSEWGDNPYNNYERSHNSEIWNPVAQLARVAGHSDEYGLLATPFIQIEPLKGLVLRSQFGINARFRLSDSFTPKFSLDTKEQATVSTASRTMNNWVDWNWTNTITWMKTFNKVHNLNLMGGYTMEKFQNYWLTGSRDNTPTNDPNMQYVSAGTQNYQATGINSYQSLISYLGRVMYNYGERYYVTASVRVDGSSKFVKGNKYAVFPAASVAWRVTGEKFMQNQHVFDNLKLRFGWGRVGNQSIDDAAYQTYVNNTEADYVFGSTPDRAQGTTIANIGNTNLQWETVEDIDLGVDMAFLQNRLTVTAEWFKKKTKDMLLKKDNLLILGYPMWNGQMWQNIGSMNASGWELSVNWADRKGDWNYSVGVNLSSVKNKAGALNGQPLYTGTFNGNYIIRNDEHAEISRFYGYVVDGIFQNQQEVNSYTNKNGEKMQANAHPGDFRYKDVNGDGQVNDDDKTFIGNAFPKLMAGLNVSVSWKNIDFTTNFYGTFGNDIFNTARQNYSGMSGDNIYAGTLEKAWHGEGTSDTYPRLSASDPNGNYTHPSTFFVENGSYFRCKLLQIGYTLPKAWTKNIQLRLSFSVQNPFTITGYSGLDPEMASLGQSVTEAGIDYTGYNNSDSRVSYTNYPNPRTYLFGLNINF